MTINPNGLLGAQIKKGSLPVTLPLREMLKQYSAVRETKSHRV